MTLNDLLNKFKEFFMAGHLTLAREVTPATFIMGVTKTDKGPIYWQHTYEQLPEPYQKAFAGKRWGDTVGQHKIMGIYDCWE
jgi:hypothetical protein